MNKSLTVYDKIDNPIAAIDSMGEWIGKSGMAGVRNVEAGKVVALVCMCRGIDLFDFIRTYHIVDDKPTMRADAMLAEFRTKYGGDHDVIESSPERAAIRIKPRDKAATEFSLTWQEAQQARWPWRDPADHSKGLKTNWSTPSDRQDMLWARCVSRALRKVHPEISSGVYTPEEMIDVAQENGEARAKTVDVEQFVKQQSGHSEVVSSEISDESTPEQRAQIRELFGALSVTEEQINSILSKRGTSSIRQLTHEQAAELITKLQEKLAGQSQVPDDVTSAHKTGAVDQDMVDRIKSLLDGQPDLIKQIAEHLRKHNKQKIAELTQGDAELLANSLEIKSMDAFFERSLAEPGKK